MGLSDKQLEELRAERHADYAAEATRAVAQAKKDRVLGAVSAYLDSLEEHADGINGKCDMRKNEKSWRSLVVMAMRDIVLAHPDFPKGSIPMQLDLVRALLWVMELPQELCPEVVSSVARAAQGGSNA